MLTDTTHISIQAHINIQTHITIQATITVQNRLHFSAETTAKLRSPWFLWCSPCLEAQQTSPGRPGIRQLQLCLHHHHKAIKTSNSMQMRDREREHIMYTSQAFKDRITEVHKPTYSLSVYLTCCKVKGGIMIRNCYIQNFFYKGEKSLLGALVKHFTTLCF